MDDILKGKEILVGREPENARLLINIAGTNKAAAIGMPHSVPNSVSRLTPNGSHCKISINQAGVMELHNMKDGNHTYVDGIGIDTWKINKNDKITLGKDNFLIDLNSILAMATKMLGGHQGPEVDIRHLERVWDEYHNQLIAIQKKQRRIGVIQGFSYPITMLGSCAFFFMDKSFLTFIPTIIAGICAFYSTYLRITDKSIDEREELKNQFMCDYVCPNCKTFLGEKPYKILIQQKQCGGCGAKLKH